MPYVFKRNMTKQFANAVGSDTPELRIDVRPLKNSAVLDLPPRNARKDNCEYSQDSSRNCRDYLMVWL